MGVAWRGVFGEGRYGVDSCGFGCMGFVFTLRWTIEVSRASMFLGSQLEAAACVDAEASQPPPTSASMPWQASYRLRSTFDTNGAEANRCRSSH